MNNINSTFSKATQDVFAAKSALKAEMMLALSLDDISQHDAAYIISKSFHEPVKRNSGESYFQHIKRVHRADETYPDIVFNDKQRILALLHDIVEDSKGLWTFKDFEELGYDQEIIEGLKALTKGEDELYLDYIERVGQNDLARMVKLADNRDNHSDNPSVNRRKLYNISTKYLWQIEFNGLEKGSSIEEFAKRIGKYDAELFAKRYSNSHLHAITPPIPSNDYRPL